MSFLSMYAELTGAVPKLPVDYARTLVNRAWRDVRRSNLWSFQLFESNWVSPALINAGSVTTTQGLNMVTFDADASAAISAVALSGPFPTNLLSRQFRVGISTIYNIWSYSVDNSNIVTLTLDRPYTDASAAGVGYRIYQCYYEAPYQDFLMWISVRDIIDFVELDLWTTREQINLMDPQRSIFYIPSKVVGYQQQQNPNAATYGVPMFELWGQPLSVFTYQTYGIRKGTDLVNDTDNLPPSIGEDVVMPLARMYAYEWAEANKGDMPRNAGSDFKFLMGAAKAEYDKLVRDARRQDREYVDNWWSIRRHRSLLGIPFQGYYTAIGGIASPGSPW